MYQLRHTGTFLFPASVLGGEDGFWRFRVRAKAVVAGTNAPLPPTAAAGREPRSLANLSAACAALDRLKETLLNEKS